MARKQNSWLVHVKKTLRENRDKSFKQVLKLAKKTYKKSASASSKGARKSRRYNKTKRGGMKKCGDGLDHEDTVDCKAFGGDPLEGGNRHRQSGGTQDPKLPMMPGAQKGGNPIMDMVKGATEKGASQKGGSGTGGGGSKAEFGANAGSV
jgi:hypothetical protein